MELVVDKHKNNVKSSRYTSFCFSFYKNQDIKIVTINAIVADIKTVNIQVVGKWEVTVDKTSLLKCISYWNIIDKGMSWIIKNKIFFIKYILEYKYLMLLYKKRVCLYFDI